MLGARPLTNEELGELFSMVNRFHTEQIALRQTTLYTVALAAGLRINEARTLMIRDVATASGEVGDTIYLRPENVKGKRRGENQVIAPIGARAIEKWLRYSGGLNLPGDPVLFPVNKSTRGVKWVTDHYKCIGLAVAHQHFCEMMKVMDFPGNVSFHSFRKTAGTRFYYDSGCDIVATSRFLRHADTQVTLRYLGLDEVNVRKTVAGMFAGGW